MDMSLNNKTTGKKTIVPMVPGALGEQPAPHSVPKIRAALSRKEDFL